MGINLVTFAAQTVTPQDDALIYETALQESGMIYGGTVTIKSANVLHIAAGHGALCGRKFTIEETDVAVGLTPSGSLLGRIYIHMDLSDTGEPISFQTETANSLTPVIQQSDVNINNGVYEINLATFTVDTSTISNLVNVAPFIDISPDSEFSASSNNPLMNKAITKAIGDPETIGGSASQPYTKGALLLATDGQIYEVTQNIALHGSIVNGGNVSPTGNIISQISNCTNLINELSTLETKSGSGSYYSQYRLTKVGKVVFVYIYNIIASTLSQDIVIMTLPAGYRPVQNMVVCGTTQNGQLQASNNAQFYSIGTDGKIKSYTYFAINGGQLLATFITS